MPDAPCAHWRDNVGAERGNVLIRLSVGVEDFEDLREDLDQALSG